MDVTIARFENDFAIIELENGETMRVPRAEIPTEYVEGDTIALTFGINPAALDRTEQARDVLNELLGGET